MMPETSPCCVPSLRGGVSGGWAVSSSHWTEWRCGAAMAGVTFTNYPLSKSTNSLFTCSRFFSLRAIF